MLCTWLSWVSVLVAAVLSSKVVPVASGDRLSTSKAAYGMNEEHAKLTRERPTFAVYALINNVACERCFTNASFLDKAKKCLPRSVNLKTKTCLREEQYLLEYRCYVKRLRMKMEQLYCLLRANELSPNPGLNVAPTEASPDSTAEPLIRWPSRRPYRQVFYADNSSDFSGSEVQPSPPEPSTGAYELHPDGHRPYRRPDQEDKESGDSSAPPGEDDYGDEISRWRENYWKKHRYVPNEDNDGDIDDDADGQHQESGRQPRRQQNRRKGVASPNLEDATEASDELQSRPYRRRGLSGSAAGSGRKRAPQRDYDGDQVDALDKSHVKRTRGPQGDYDVGEGEASDRNLRKRRKGPPGDYEDDEEWVPTNGRRKSRPQKGYDAEQGDVAHNSRRTRTRGRPGDYEESEESISANGPKRRTKGPQGGYDATRGEGPDNDSRKRTRGPPRDYEDDWGAPSSVRRRLTRGPQRDYHNEQGDSQDSNNRRGQRPGKYEDDQEDFQADNRRRTRRPQEGYHDGREEALENHRGKRRKVQRDYDAGADDVPANWRGRTRGPQGGYDTDQGGVVSIGRRRTRFPGGSYEGDRDSSPDWSGARENDRTSSHVSGSGGDRDYEENNAHDIGEFASTEDTDLNRRMKTERRGGRGRSLTTADTDEELGSEPRRGERSHAEGSGAFTEGIDNGAVSYNPSRRRGKNQSKRGDNVLDTTRAGEAKKLRTTESGFEDFINFDDDGSEEESSEESGTGGEERSDKGRIPEARKTRNKRHTDERNRPALYDVMKIVKSKPRRTT
ncbi:hypothetical protein HPB50_009139 [Hyalomma asiaticum]|uniref:Uncharacterized protein n=1 Tax=Hyalomma asiaticum TaxID=266040 RepID=A0ACB7T0H4_HYAAI|nr:hypothetical protein HPB50_009139 [Hyalomma asiaticum]